MLFNSYYLAFFQTLMTKKRCIYSYLYLKMNWSTKAITIYSPDRINKAISFPVIDLHCQKNEFISLSQATKQLLKLLITQMQQNGTVKLLSAESRVIFYRGKTCGKFIAHTSIFIPASCDLWNNLLTLTISSVSCSCHKQYLYKIKYYYTDFQK